MPETRTKLDSYMSSVLKSYSEDQFVSVLVKFGGRVFPEQVKKLRKIGCSIRSQAGDVATIGIQVGKIDQLINADFVEFVELSRPLKIEKEEM